MKLKATVKGLSLALLLTSSAYSSDVIHWGYTKLNWGSLKPEFHTCKDGLN